jgi:hypothetical protein
MNRYLVKPSQKAIEQGYTFKAFQFDARDEDEARRRWCVNNDIIAGHAHSGLCDVELLESDVIPSPPKTPVLFPFSFSYKKANGPCLWMARLNRACSFFAGATTSLVASLPSGVNSRNSA